MLKPISTLLQTPEGIVGSVIALGFVVRRLTDPKNYRFVRRFNRKRRK